MEVLKLLGTLCIAFVIIPWVGIVLLKILMDYIDKNDKFD
tara:strand:- start:523 stop:642 length:120 start_codon:yes stop_codon:yes gene_type:complete